MADDKTKKSEKPPRMLVYLGNRGDQGAPFEIHGCRFEKLVATPVTDSVFVFFEKFHNFREIRKIASGVMDWPPRPAAKEEKRR